MTSGWMYSMYDIINLSPIPCHTLHGSALFVLSFSYILAHCCVTHNICTDSSVKRRTILVHKSHSSNSKRPSSSVPVYYPVLLAQHPNYSTPVKPDREDAATCRGWTAGLAHPSTKQRPLHTISSPAPRTRPTATRAVASSAPGGPKRRPRSALPPLSSTVPVVAAVTSPGNKTGRLSASSSAF